MNCFVGNLLDDMDPLKPASNGMNNNNNNTNNNMHNNSSSMAPKVTPLKTPQSFLGENSALVNLDNLIKPATTNSTSLLGNSSSNSGGGGGAASHLTANNGGSGGGVFGANPFSDNSPRGNFFPQQPVSKAML